MIYLDSNIFVYAAMNNGQSGEKSRKLLFDIKKRKIPAYTSILTWDEVVYTIWKKRGKEIALKYSKLFLQLQNIIFVDADYKTISMAQQLMLKYHLKPRDAIHAATAIKNKIKKFASDDSDFDKVKELKRIKIN